MILRDVTQRREMLDSLLKAERLAAAGTFAAGVAREVNNPLASISSLVQSILTGENDPERRTLMHTILSQITRIRARSRTWSISRGPPPCSANRLTSTGSSRRRCG